MRVAGRKRVTPEIGTGWYRLTERVGIYAVSVGSRQVVDAAGVGRTIIEKIINGKKTQCRARTERRILGVTTGAIADHAVVSARKTWTMLDRLLRDGFTKSELARRLGYKTPALQIKRTFCLAVTELRVRKFYNIIYAGEGKRGPKTKVAA